jgi:hypothetical protein
MRSNKDLELLPYNPEIEETTKGVKEKEARDNKKFEHHGRQQVSQARHMDFKGFCSPTCHENRFRDQEIEDLGQQF